MTAKRSRSKFTVYRPVLLTPVANERLEATLDAETAKGRQGLTFADLLREGVDLVIDRYSPNGKGLRKHKPAHRRVTDRGYKKTVTKVTQEVTPTVTNPLPKGLTADDIAPDETPPFIDETGKLKCDGQYIATVRDGKKKKLCSYCEGGYCIKEKQPLNCPKLPKDTVKARLLKSKQIEGETKGDD